MLQPLDTIKNLTVFIAEWIRAVLLQKFGATKNQQTDKKTYEINPLDLHQMKRADKNKYLQKFYPARNIKIFYDTPNNKKLKHIPNISTEPIFSISKKNPLLASSLYISIPFW